MRLAGLASRGHQALLARRWLVLQLALLGGLVGGLIVLHEQPRYASSAYVTGPAQSRSTVRRACSRRCSTAVPLAASRRPRWPHIHAAPRGLGTIEFRVTNRSPDRVEALATSYARAFASLHGKQQLVVTPAVGAVRIWPRPVRTILIGVLLGLLGGVAVAVAIEVRDRRVRSIEDVEHALGLPMLGVPRAIADKDDFALLASPYGEPAESYRMLRANLEAAALDPTITVIMVTGALDGEGRTTTAANLAISYALGGHLVALADVSLRYPALARRFGLENRPGLTDVALDHVPLSSALARVDLQAGPALVRPSMAPPGQLDVLPAGPEPSTPPTSSARPP